MSEDLKQGARLGNNELLLRVGRGGMATVWVARERRDDPKDDRLVAVKAMLQELAEDCLAHLVCDDVLPCYDVCFPTSGLKQRLQFPKIRRRR